MVETLSGAIGAGLTPAGEAAAVSSGAGPYGYASRIEDALKRYRVSSGPGKLFFSGPTSVKKDIPAVAPVNLSREETVEPEPSADRHCFSDLQYIGQTAGTYLIFTGEEGMVLVDQHAAHERVLFEKLRRQAQGEKAVGQRLLLPEVLSLPPGDIAFLTETSPILEEAGMEVEPFGGDSVVIKAIPAFLSHAEARTLLLDLLADCAETDRGLPLQEKREKIFTALACRGAVKANRNMTGPEVAGLCRELDAAAHAATCPHGRPLAVSISVIELEKRFKRR
jgi:DNA mismatch repair protein MutL